MKHLLLMFNHTLTPSQSDKPNFQFLLSLSLNAKIKPLSLHQPWLFTYFFVKPYFKNMKIQIKDYATVRGIHRKNIVITFLPKKTFLAIYYKVRTYDLVQGFHALEIYI